MRALFSGNKDEKKFGTFRSGQNFQRSVPSGQEVFREEVGLVTDLLLNKET